jgi:hypothetical protein
MSPALTSEAANLFSSADKGHLSCRPGWHLPFWKLHPRKAPLPGRVVLNVRSHGPPGTYIGHIVGGFKMEPVIGPRKAPDSCHSIPHARLEGPVILRDPKEAYSGISHKSNPSILVRQVPTHYTGRHGACHGALELRLGDCETGQELATAKQQLATV